MTLPAEKEGSGGTKKHMREESLNGKESMKGAGGLEKTISIASTAASVLQGLIAVGGKNPETYPMGCRPEIHGLRRKDSYFGYLNQKGKRELAIMKHGPSSDLRNRARRGGRCQGPKRAARVGGNRVLGGGLDVSEQKK